MIQIRREEVQLLLLVGDKNTYICTSIKYMYVYISTYM